MRLHGVPKWGGPRDFITDFSMDAGLQGTKVMSRTLSWCAQYSQAIQGTKAILKALT